MTLEEQIQEASDQIDALLFSMQQADTSIFEMNFTDKVLRPAIHGLIAAHAVQTPTVQVENAIVDTFTSIIVELLKRTHKSRVKSRANADEAGIHAQQLVNQIAAQLSEMIDDQFAPKIELVKH